MMNNTIAEVLEIAIKAKMKDNEIKTILLTELCSPQEVDLSIVKEKELKELVLTIKEFKNE